jgi:hypothetical protein
MTPDWSATPEPVPYAKLGDPQSLNLYSYVRNNPTSFYDPDGHCWSWAQALCNFGQRIGNEFTGYGWHTNQQVDEAHRQGGLWAKQNGLSGDKASYKQLAKIGFAVTATRPSAAAARAIWQKATGEKVPFDPKYNRFYDMQHKTAIADGGSPRDPNNLEPMQHDEHMEFHKENGDFARWGQRAQAGTDIEQQAARDGLTVGEEVEMQTRQQQRPMGQNSDIPGDVDPN